MKQYTSQDQTAKLIELGFEKPRIDAGVTKWEGYEPICTGSYTLGELIEMLPKPTDDSGILHIEAYDYIGWDVWYGYYGNGDEVMVKYSAENKELIDALFDMVVRLKEEGVI